MTDDPPPEPPPPEVESQDDGDDELMRIPRAPMRRSPLVAIASIVVGVVMLVRLAADARYAMRGLGGGEPLDLGDARAIDFDGKDLADNSVVVLRGLADYRNALVFEPREDRHRRSFYRMLGTGDRLWVRADETATRHALSDRVVGRLRRFDALPYAAQIREYYETDVPVTRTIDLEALRRALSPDKPVAGSLPDRAGLMIEPDGGREAIVVARFESELRITLSKRRFAVEEDARHEAERLGAPVGPALEMPTEFEYPVRLRPGQLNEYIAGLDERGFGYALRRSEFHTRLDQLRAGDGDTLSLPWAADHPAVLDEVDGRLVERPRAERTSLRFADVVSVQIPATIRIPADAWVVIENELPAEMRWVLLLTAGLCVFIAFNLWLLTRRLRGRMNAAP